MTDKERMDYIFLVRNAVEMYQSELKSAQVRYEDAQALYFSACLALKDAVELYENRINKLRKICAKHGLSEVEIELLIKWREE